jgi:hypothetical protein
MVWSIPLSQGRRDKNGQCVCCIVVVPYPSKLEVQVRFLSYALRNTLASLNDISLGISLGPVAQLVRALPCHGRGRQFKSGQDRKH